MPRRKRDFQKNTYYHIYNRGNNKAKVFRDSDDKRIFLDLLYKYNRCYKIKIKAYCLMDNHFHLLIKTGVCPFKLSLLMQRFMTAYCIYINKKYKRVGHVFQGRYNARSIRSREGFDRVVKYILENPVKAGFVKNAEDYKWTRVCP